MGDQIVAVEVWIADDGSGDLFFGSDEWAKGLTGKAGVTIPAHGLAIEPHLWETFVKQQIEQNEEWDAKRRAQGKEPFEHSPITFYPRTFRRTEIRVAVLTRDWPTYLNIDNDAERLRLAEWKALCQMPPGDCCACGEGRLIPDGRRRRCLNCEHGPSDWQRKR